MQGLRFICLLEPTDTWAVWDEQTCQPATGPTPTTGLTEQAAKAECLRLSRRYRLMTELRISVVDKAS